MVGFTEEMNLTTRDSAGSPMQSPRAEECEASKAVRIPEARLRPGNGQGRVLMLGADRLH